MARGIPVDERPFAKSTLQLFRARLILHDKARAVFQHSLQFARKTGYAKDRRMKAALNTSQILGRGAVKDTSNLVADGIIQVVRAVAALEGLGVHHCHPTQQPCFSILISDTSGGSSCSCPHEPQKHFGSFIGKNVIVYMGVNFLDLNIRSDVSFQSLQIGKIRLVVDESLVEQVKG